MVGRLSWIMQISPTYSPESLLKVKSFCSVIRELTIEQVSRDLTCCLNKWRKRARAKECWKLLEAGKNKEIGFLLCPPKETQPC